MTRTRRRAWLALAGTCLLVFLVLDAGPLAALVAVVAVVAVVGVLGLLAWTAGS